MTYFLSRQSNVLAMLVLSTILSPASVEAFSTVSSDIDAEHPHTTFIAKQATIAADEIVLIDSKEVTILPLEDVATNRDGFLVFPIVDSIGFLNSDVAIKPKARKGSIILTDGQQLPGETLSPSDASTEDDGDSLQWSHQWFGPLSVPINRIATITFISSSATQTPQDNTTTRNATADVVTLINDDRVEGFLLGISEQVMIETEDDQIIELPIDRVATIHLINPTTLPERDVRRIWFDEGSVVDAASLRLGDDGFLRFRPTLASSSGERPVNLSKVAGVLFDPTALVPLADLLPHDVVGPVTRYMVPEPKMLDEEPAALGLHDITFRGPVVARYTLPKNAVRFSATIQPRSDALHWSGFEVVVYDDDREVFRELVSPRQSELPVDVELNGSELTIELTQGEHGPIHNSITLLQPRILRAN